MITYHLGIIRIHRKYLQYIAFLLVSALQFTYGVNINQDNHQRSGSVDIGIYDQYTQNLHDVNASEIAPKFHPDSIVGLNLGDTTTIYVNHSSLVESYGEDFRDVIFKVVSLDDSIARVISVTVPQINESFHTVVVEGVFIGRTHLLFTYESPTLRNNTGANHNPVDDSSTIHGGDSSQDHANWHHSYMYDISVIREDGWLDRIFMLSVSLVVLISNISLGCTVDLDVVREVLRKPIAPLIGFSCQFAIMPLVAYSLVVFFDIRGGQALGFFATGCSPGGGASNMYAYLLGGDVSLSVTMTLVSTTASFAMIPLWLYTLGTHFIDDETNIRIPFENILASLAGILVPVAIGILMQRKKPKWAANLRRCLKPLFIFLIIFLFTFGMWVNSYLFGLFTMNLVIASCLLPFVGFALSAGAALACRQPCFRVITILIETGIQNTGIPILIMKFSLPQPEADMSVISPVMITFFEPMPLWVAIASIELYKKFCSSSSEEDKTNNSSSNPAGQKDGANSDNNNKTANLDICQQVFSDSDNENDDGALSNRQPLKYKNSEDIVIFENSSEVMTEYVTLQETVGLKIGGSEC